MMVMIHCRHRADLVRHHVIVGGEVGRVGLVGWMCCVVLVWLRMAPVLFYYYYYFYLIHEHINVTYIINITVVI